LRTIPTDPDELSALAGEYVLGTLDARAARMIEDALPAHAGLRTLVSDWERRLAPLSNLAAPEAPPPELWDRIAAQIAPPSRIVTRPRFARLWQGWAVGASLVAVALAAVALLPSQQDQRIMTVLVSDRTQTAWTAEVDRQGGLKLASVNAPGGTAVNTAPEGKVLQLWALPPGATTPTSLGLLPRGTGDIKITTPAVKPVPGMLIEISLEPPGGSPLGNRPSGPVLFIGRLSAAGPAT
jgi:anti-sigma-K factor RskA